MRTNNLLVLTDNEILNDLFDYVPLRVWESSFLKHAYKTVLPCLYEFKRRKLLEAIDANFQRLHEVWYEETTTLAVMHRGTKGRAELANKLRTCRKLHKDRLKANLKALSVLFGDAAKG